MRDIVAQQLKDLLKEQEERLLADPKFLKERLSECCDAEHWIEVNLLVHAMNCGVIDELILMRVDKPTESQLKAMTPIFADRLDIQDEAAEWIIRSWAIALQLVDSDPPSFPLPVEDKEEEKITKPEPVMATPQTTIAPEPPLTHTEEIDDGDEEEIEILPPLAESETEAIDALLDEVHEIVEETREKKIPLWLRAKVLTPVLLLILILSFYFWPSNQIVITPTDDTIATNQGITDDDSAEVQIDSTVVTPDSETEDTTVATTTVDTPLTTTEPVDTEQTPETPVVENTTSTDSVQATTLPEQVVESTIIDSETIEEIMKELPGELSIAKPSKSKLSNKPPSKTNPPDSSVIESVIQSQELKNAEKTATEEPSPPPKVTLIEKVVEDPIATSVVDPTETPVTEPEISNPVEENITPTEKEETLKSPTSTSQFDWITIVPRKLHAEIGQTIDLSVVSVQANYTDRSKKLITPQWAVVSGGGILKDNTLTLTASRAVLRAYYEEKGIKRSAKMIVSTNAVPTKSSETSTVIFTSQPTGAAIEIDGRPFAEKTDIRVKDFPVGRHTIKLRLKGKDITKTINVRPGIDETIRADFTSSSDSDTRDENTEPISTSTDSKIIISRNNPDAKIYLNGKFVGTGNMMCKGVKPGFIKIDIIEGTNSISKGFFLRPSRNATVTVDNQRQKLFIKSDR